MRKFRTAAALALCAVCLLQTAAPVLAAEDYPAPDVSGKTVEELIDAFRAEHDLTEDNFELSYYNTVTGESYDFNETKMLYGASTYKLPLNLYYYDMQLAGEITGDSLATAEQWGKLRRHVGKILRDIAGEIGTGNIDADPYLRSGNRSYCDFCDYADACFFEEGSGRDCHRYLYPVKGQRFWESAGADENEERGQRHGG